MPAAFDPEAILAIYNETNGNFLTSNTVLEKCLIEAANKSARRITTFIVEKALGAGFIKQKTAENPAVIEAVKDKEKLATTLLSSEGKKPEKFDRIPNAGHQKVSKNEYERSGSIKLSSLFKQEKD